MSYSNPWRWSLVSSILPSAPTLSSKHTASPSLLRVHRIGSRGLLPSRPNAIQHQNPNKTLSLSSLLPYGALLVPVPFSLSLYLLISLRFALLVIGYSSLTSNLRSRSPSPRQRPSQEKTTWRRTWWRRWSPAASLRRSICSCFRWVVILVMKMEGNEGDFLVLSFAFAWIDWLQPIIMNWLRLRWFKRRLLEMYFQFMFVFIFFPG